MTFEDFYGARYLIVAVIIIGIISSIFGVKQKAHIMEVYLGSFIISSIGFIFYTIIDGIVNAYLLNRSIIDALLGGFTTSIMLLFGIHIWIIYIISGILIGITPSYFIAKKIKNKV